MLSLLLVHCSVAPNHENVTQSNAPNISIFKKESSFMKFNIVYLYDNISIHIIIHVGFSVKFIPYEYTFIDSNISMRTPHSKLRQVRLYFIRYFFRRGISLRLMNYIKGNRDMNAAKK